MLRMSYSHIISGGGGLIGAVKMDSATASIRRQIARRLSGSMAGMYAQNDLLGSVSRREQRMDIRLGNRFAAARFRSAS